MLRSANRHPVWMLVASVSGLLATGLPVAAHAAAPATGFARYTIVELSKALLGRRVLR